MEEAGELWETRSVCGLEVLKGSCLRGIHVDAVVCAVSSHLAIDDDGLRQRRAFGGVEERGGWRGGSRGKVANG